MALVVPAVTPSQLPGDGGVPAGLGALLGSQRRGRCIRKPGLEGEEEADFTLGKALGVPHAAGTPA